MNYNLPFTVHHTATMKMHYNVRAIKASNQYAIQSLNCREFRLWINPWANAAFLEGNSNKENWHTGATGDLRSLTNLGLEWFNITPCHLWKFGAFANYWYEELGPLYLPSNLFDNQLRMVKSPQKNFLAEFGQISVYNWIIYAGFNLFTA